MRKEVSNEKKTLVYIGGFELPDKNAAAHRVVSNAEIFRELWRKKAMGIEGRNKVEKEFDRKFVVKKYINELNIGMRD
mgnify:FL=1